LLNIDLAPTLIDFAGVPVPKEMQGRSWRPLVRGHVVEWRKAFFYEYFFEQGYAGYPDRVRHPHRDAKLIKYPAPTTDRNLRPQGRPARNE